MEHPLHDGLQFDTPDFKRPFGFGADEIRILKTKDSQDGKKAVGAPEGSWVEIPLPNGHPEIETGDLVYLSSSAEVKRTYTFQRPKPGLYAGKLPINITVTITAQGISMAAVSADDTNPRRLFSAEVFEAASLDAARKPERIHDVVDKAVRRTGRTRFTVKKVLLENPSQCMAPSSVLNAARRKLTDQLETAYKQDLLRMYTALDKQAEALLPTTEPARQTPAAFRYSIKVESASAVLQIPDSVLNSLSEVIFNMCPLRPEKNFLTDMLKCLEILQPKRFRAALPVITRADTYTETCERIQLLRDAGVTHWQISNLSGWDLLGLSEDCADSMDVSGDWPLYSTNSHAVHAWLERGLSGVTLSPENTLKNSGRIAARYPDQITAIVYQDTPLFISAACAKAAYHEKCPKPADRCAPCEWPLINDRWNESIRVITAGCQTVTVNEVPYSRLDEMEAVGNAGIRNVRSDFIFREYTPETISEIIRKMITRP